MQNLDDFPVSPGLALDTVEFYKAFLQARSVLGQAPKRLLGASHDDELRDLTSHFYQQTKFGKPLLRAVLMDEASILGSLWLSRVQAFARRVIALAPMQPFRGLEKEQMSQLVHLSSDPESSRKIEAILKDWGVLLLHEPAIAGAKIDGAAFRLQGGTPVVALSLRYSRLDQYWFTLMHELAHVSMHLERLDEPIVDDLDLAEESYIELQANRLAAEVLIPRNEWRTCHARKTKNAEDVFEFAARLGIAPEIVAGRIQRESGRHDIFSKITGRVNMREIFFGRK